MQQSFYSGEHGEGDLFELADGTTLFAIRTIAGQQVNTLRHSTREGKIVRYEKLISSSDERQPEPVKVQDPVFVTSVAQPITSSFTTV